MANKIKMDDKDGQQKKTEPKEKSLLEAFDEMDQAEHEQTVKMLKHFKRGLLG